MANIVRTPSGTWKAVIRKAGWPTTIKTFRLKKDADDWSRRTEHAHHHLLQSFADAGIANACKGLAFAASLLRWDGVDGTMFTQEELADPRTRFIMTAVLMSQRLSVDALGTKRQEAREPIKST